jgi:hypothetical protein
LGAKTAGRENRTPPEHGFLPDILRSYSPVS